ncbi:MAG: FAD-dependent oxidoreductase [Candidatus Sumerlaeota bacterium]|nr:FAD-dependent oxidoreductase [Candidatus Sumerlaeota bacterium]
MKSIRRNFILAAAGGGLGALAAIPVASAQTAETNNRNLAGVISIPERKLPILAEADVVVCGGGTAGISAAYCAARHGAKVILLERWPSVGGMATNALVNIWHTSDRAKQVIRGFVQEAVDRGERFVRRMADFPKRPETHVFDSTGMRVVFHQMLKEAGVRVLCNLTAIESVVEDGRIRAVLVDTKIGRKAVRGKIFIDATGDGDVAANAGLPFDLGRPSDGAVQGMTMMFRLRGLDAAKVKAHPDDADRVLQLMRKMRDEGRFPQFNEGAARSYLRSPRDTSVPYNMCPVSGNPLDEEELTRISAQSREQVYQYLDLWREKLPGFEKAEVDEMGFALGIRESRRIRGLKTLDAQMVVKAVKQPDAIGHGFWMIDIHDPKGSGYTTWTDQKVEMMPPAGDSYHIPLGISLNAQIPNLAVVGRCASATHEACASVRLQSHCMVMGQGVGTCAALALDARVSMAQVDVRKLQSALRKDGVYLESVPETGQ